MSHHQIHRLVLITSLVAGASANVEAQGPVAAGQTVELLSHPGLRGQTVKLRGTLVQAGPDSVTIRLAEGDRTVPLADIAGFKVRQVSRQTQKGASLGMMVGLLATGFAPESNYGVVFGAAVAGAALGWLVRLPEYRKTPVSELRPDPLLGTVVRVQRFIGPVTGSLVEAGPQEIVVETQDRHRVVVPRQEVEGLAWRSGKGKPSVAPPLVLGAVGLIVGLAVANEEPCTPNDWFCAPGMETGLNGMAGLAIGVVVGAGISFMLPRPWHWEKAPKPTPRLMLEPTAGGGIRVGVSQAIRFR